MKGSDKSAGDFADLRSIFSRALDIVGKGAGVSEALDSALRELYPYTFADIRPHLLEVFEETKTRCGWGDLRALRELASGKSPANLSSVEDTREGASLGLPPTDLRRVFDTAYKKCAAGFKPEDALEMACMEHYPMIHRKVLEAAKKRLEYLSKRDRVSTLTAIKRLSGGGP